MKKTFTPKYIKDNKGCYSDEQVLKLSFIKKKTISIDDILNSEIPLKDKCWFVIKKCELTIDQKKELAYSLALSVLPIYEKKYPNDKRVKECLIAIKKYNVGKISLEDLKQKRDAAAYAADADADADAAYAADAAAAAYAASTAADAYTFAAYAAADAYAAAAAADAAAYAADATDYKTIVLNVLKKFCKKIA